MSAARPVGALQQVGPRMGKRGKGAAMASRWNSWLKMSLRGQPGVASLTGQAPASWLGSRPREFRAIGPRGQAF